MQARWMKRRNENGDKEKFYPITHKSAVIGIENIDNTSDMDKPISIAVQTVLDEKVAITRKINNYPLLEDINLTASDVGADPFGTASSLTEVLQEDIVILGDEVNDHIADNDIHFSSIERIKLTNVEENANNYQHPLSGINGGTYKSVTVDENGHVTSGTNPTTLAEFGITDAEEKGTVNTHNIAEDSHNDIRLLISELSTQVNSFLDVDDDTKDQLSEVITLIENNSDLIDGITTSKVNVDDIVDDLATNVSKKPLSASQGVAIKVLIDALQGSLDAEIANRESADTQSVNTAKSYTDTSIANQTTETWTFTFVDGTTTTKKVVVK